MRARTNVNATRATIRSLRSQERVIAEHAGLAQISHSTAAALDSVLSDEAGKKYGVWRRWPGRTWGHLSPCTSSFLARLRRRLGQIHGRNHHAGAGVARDGRGHPPAGTDTRPRCVPGRPRPLAGDLGKPGPSGGTWRLALTPPISAGARTPCDPKDPKRTPTCRM